MIDTETAQPEGFKIFHPALKKEVLLPATIGEGENAIETKGLIEGIIAKSRTEQRGALTKQVQEYEAKLADYEETRQRLEALEGSTMTAQERLKREQETRQKEIEKHKSEAMHYKQMLHSEKLSNALYKQVSQNPEIFNAEQAAKLFQAECSPRLIEDGDELKSVAVLDGQELALSEAFSKWIAKDSNANLLKNKLSPGGGSTGGQKVAANNSMTRANFTAMKTADQFAFINSGGQVTE